VAESRYVGRVPKIHDVNTQTFYESYQKQHDFLATAKLKRIGKEFDGMSFSDPNAKSLWKRMKRLRLAGYRVPKIVFAILKVDIETDKREKMKSDRKKYNA